MDGGTGEDGVSGGGVVGGSLAGYPQMDEASLSAKRAKMEGADSDRLLNFATAADEFELSLKRQKIPRDPMSHRIIEKRRRDRMNNCLADLSRLIPASYHKQGQGRIEKTEIIEMAIKHINMLQQRVDELEKKVANQAESSKTSVTTLASTPQTTSEGTSSKFYMGFKEAQDEVMRFLVEVESINTMDPFCKKIMKHLENASQKFVIKDQKTELSPMDPESSVSQTPIYSHHNHPAFYSTQSSVVGSGGGGGGGTPLPDDGVPGGKSTENCLRYLLGDQPSSLLGQVMTGSGSETGEDRRGSLPMFSYSSHLSGVSSVMGSSGYISDASNIEKNSPSGSNSSRDNVYKFKHNITKRFSQEGRHHHHHHRHRYSHHHHVPPHHQHTSDTSSNTSSRDLEDDQGQLRWKGGGSGKHKSGGSGGGSSSMFTDDMGTENNSPNSDECNSGSNSGNSSSMVMGMRGHHRGYNNSNSKSGQTGGRTSPDCHNTLSSSTGQSSNCTTTSSSSIALPGFILHPSGTHYMPISVHNSNISGLFDNNGDQEGMPVFHPISIPVHFRRPVISMPNITICTHLSKQKDHNSIKD